jgi:elongation of very long chain fatty acids protein 4
MSSPLPTLYLSFAYLFLVIILGFLMRHVRELKIKYLILLYNTLSMFLNIYICIKIIYIKYKASDFYLCTSIDSQGSPYSIEMNKIIWWFFVLKGVEFLDTIFFLLRKKFHKISFLHIYNHATMFPIWWIGVSYLANGTSAVAVFLNSFLHVLLYYYYCISTIGPKFQKYVWWKKYFVLLQMVCYTL